MEAEATPVETATEEQPKVDTLESLQVEYTKLAQIFGDMNYKIKCFQDDAANVAEQMRNVNQRAHALKQGGGNA